MIKRLVGAIAMAGISSSAALAGGHYAPGVDGVNVASVPPPGVYYSGYLINYNINDFKAPGSTESLPGRNKGTVNVFANRFVWITNGKFLGADYGVEAIVPIVRSSLGINTMQGPISDSRTEVGDIYLSPLILSWHGPQWDTGLGMGFWLDNGRSGNLASAGKGYKSTMITAGGTYFFDEHRTLSVSALSRYEYNGKDDAGMRPGQQLSLEWGLGKSFSNYTLGLVGYSQWQTTRDKGIGASNSKYQTHALGVELTYPIMSAGIFLRAAVYKEFKVEGGTQPQPKGSLVRFSLSKAF